MARNYVPTGKPRGGKREGSGRRPGKNALGYGQVKAVKAAGLRVPESATPDQKDLADESLHTMTLVMRGKIGFKQAPHRLKAATALREEICGAVKQKTEHSFSDLTDEQLEAKYRAVQERIAQEIPRGAGPTESAVPTTGADLGPKGDVS